LLQAVRLRLLTGIAGIAVLGATAAVPVSASAAAGSRTHSAHAHGTRGDSSGGGGLGSTGTTTGTTTTTTGTTTTTAPGTTDGEGTGTTQSGAMPKLKGHRFVYGSRVMHRGMTGTDVEDLQDYLTLAGFPTSVDGEFGPGTRSSVMSFEQTDGYHASGVVNHLQALALRRDVNTAVTASGSTAQATLNSDGTVTAPADAPVAVQNAIVAANAIIDTPYIYGGGHASFTSRGYDCSGAVSYALHGGGLLSAPEDSSQMETYGDAGPGQWITVYANASHAFVVIAGLAFDTAHFGLTFPAGSGPRWLAPADATVNLSDGTGGYTVRHPAGL
jgi:peptidoglycan hydrolase-like protein with peptidoglycan-binding domain